MKTALYCLALLVSILFFSLTTAASEMLRAAVDRRVFLSAIDQVESGGRDHARGRAGERSRYQLAPAVWAQHTSLAFSHSRRPDIAQAVAVKHFEWLEQGLLAAGFPADVEHLALCWNAGLSAVVHNGIQPRHRDYAERVGNLYADLKKGVAP